MFDGDMYILSASLAIGAGATVYTQAKTGSVQNNHFLETIYTFDSGGPFTVNFLEAPTMTDGTTEVFAMNMNRQSANTPDIQFFSNPTAVSGGTIIETIFIPASGLGANTTGAGISGAERIMKKSTNYSLQIINAGNASTFYTRSLFYETGN